MAKVKIEKSIKRVLSSIVSDYMRNKMMFTSLDIANQAKKTGIRVRNFQVADWLRRNAIPMSYDNAYLYNQKLITVDSKAAGMTLAYLYLPHGESSSNYLDRDQNPKSFQKKDKKSKSNVRKRVAALTKSVADTKSTGTGDGWKTQKRDSKGRWI